MKILLGTIALSAVSLTGTAVPVCGAAYATACCKVCKKGKACGDSCISRDKACHQGKGCACDG